MKKLIALVALLSAPLSLAAKCFGCLVPHVEHYPNGKKAEWTEIKCRATQEDLEGDTFRINGREVCPGCRCPLKSHALHRNPDEYYKGKKLPKQDLGRVSMGPIVPERGARS